MPAGIQGFRLRSALPEDSYHARIAAAPGLALGKRTPAISTGIGFNTNRPRGLDLPRSVVEEGGGLDQLRAVVPPRAAPRPWFTPGIETTLAARRSLADMEERTKNRSAFPVRVGTSTPQGGFGVPLALASDAETHTKEKASNRAGGLPMGPMRGIYGDRRLTGLEATDLEAVGGGLGLAGFYNRAEPRSADRAAVLKVTWGKGGVPVIGGGAARAPLRDFGGIDLSPRGIDTGIRPGTYTNDDHAAALAAHRSGDVYGGGPLEPFARLAPTRTRGSGGGGLFTGDRVRRNPSKEERALAISVALENAKNGGTIEAARLGAAAELQKASLAADAERYKADRAVEIAQDRGGPTAMPTPPRLVKIGNRYHEVETGTDGVPRYRPLSDAEQLRQGKIDAALSSLNEPETQAAALEFVRNPNKRIPMYDWKTGRIAFMDTNPRWDLGKSNWQKETVARGQPRYEYLNTVDPELMERLVEWLQTAKPE